MKTLVTVPDNVIGEIEEFIEGNYPHLKIGSYLVHAGLEKMKAEKIEALRLANESIDTLRS